jgi:hypothetical protein
VQPKKSAAPAARHRTLYSRPPRRGRTWRHTRLSPIRRIEEAATSRLIEKFVRQSDSDDDARRGIHSETTGPRLDALADGDDVVLTVDGTTHRLDAASAAHLREALGEALSRGRSFLRTACERRADGQYVVRRRRADSDGHSKVFESRTAAFELFDDLPREFVAEDVGRAGISGNRRHLLVHHFAEHPAFPCELVSKQPLTARKADVGRNR